MEQHLVGRLRDRPARRKVVVGGALKRPAIPAATRRASAAFQGVEHHLKGVYAATPLRNSPRAAIAPRDAPMGADGPTGRLEVKLASVKGVETVPQLVDGPQGIAPALSPDERTLAVREPLFWRSAWVASPGRRRVWRSWCPHTFLFGLRSQPPFQLVSGVSHVFAHPQRWRSIPAVSPSAKGRARHPQALCDLLAS